MTDKEAFINAALSFHGTEQKPHFDRIAFKVVNRRIFATLHEPTGTVNMKFNKVDQETFCSYEGGVIYPVPNKFGQQGWTTFELNKIPEELILEALYVAYFDVVKPAKENS